MKKGNKVVQNRTGVFSEKKEIPSDIAMMFDQPLVAEEWIQRINLQFGKWIKKHNKSYWDIVRFYGFRKGVLKNLSRKEFAHLLMTICSQALEESDSESSLKYTMDKFQHRDGFRKRTKEERKQQCPDVVYSNPKVYHIVIEKCTTSQSPAKLALIQQTTK